MDKQETLKIIRMIAEGEDPYKDEGRAKYLPEHNPKTLKALCTAIASMFPIDDKKNEAFSRQPLILSDFPKGLVKSFIKKLEKDAIVEALTNANKKIDETAEILGVTYSELLSKIKEHDINREFFSFAIKTDYRNLPNRFSLYEYLEIIEKNAIQKALGNTNGYKQSAAILLGASFRKLRYRINKHGIDLRNIPASINSSVLSDYFKHAHEGISLDEFLKAIEKKVIEMALEETSFQKTKAAKRLGITFRTFRYRINKLEIE